MSDSEAAAPPPNPPVPPPLPPILSGDDLERALLKAPPEVIHGVLYQGAKMMVSAPSKARKTYLLADLAVCVAQGLPWLGPQTTAGSVLYVNFELQPFALRDRLRAISMAHGTTIPANLYTWNLRGCRADLAQIQNELIAASQEGQVVLIIFDPVYKLRPGLSEIDAAEISSLLSDVEAIAQVTDAAVAWVHHFAKGNASAKESIDRASGSGVWARDPDVVLTLTPNNDETCLGVEMNLRNFEQVKPFAVRWQYPLWVRDSKIDPLDHKRPLPYGGARRKTTEAVMRHVPASGPIGRAELVETVRADEGVGTRTIENMIAALVEKRELYRWTTKRSKMRDAVGFARTPQPPPQAPV